MPERPSIGFDAGHLGPVGVAAEARLWLHIGAQFVQLDEPGFCQRRVQRAGAMALTQDESVALRPGWRSGIDLEHREIEGGKDVGGRQIAANVAEARAVDHFEVASAYVSGQVPEPIDLKLVRHGRSFSLRMDGAPLVFGRVNKYAVLQVHAKSKLAGAACQQANSPVSGDLTRIARRGYTHSERIESQLRIIMQEKRRPAAVSCHAAMNFGRSPRSPACTISAASARLTSPRR